MYATSIVPAAEVIQIPGTALWAHKIDGEVFSDVRLTETAAWLRVWQRASKSKNQAAYDLADAKLVELGYFKVNIWGPVTL